MQSFRHPANRVHAASTGGFTLVEIMVVIVILGLLATIVGSSVLGRSERAEQKTAEMNVSRIHETVEMYMVENRRQIPTWEDLLTPDATGNKYMDLVDPPTDPWGNPYEITTDPEFETKPMVLSWGPDGIQNTEDDITNRSITESKEG